MRITGLSLIASVLFLSSAAGQPAAEQTPFAVLANLATYLSQNDFPSAIALFDPQMNGYGEVYRNLDALAAQTDPSCALDILEDEESGNIHKLDVDILLTLKSKADPGRIERRRERVQIEMKQIKGKWKITAFNPLGILDPILII